MIINCVLQGHYTAMELMNVEMVVMNLGPALEVITATTILMISSTLTLGMFTDHCLDIQPVLLFSLLA